MSAQANFTLRGRNPDVLSCIANLSNDEVFTPPELANRMLDTVAEAWAANHGGANLWADKTVRFLDPCTKSGVFLREITSRLTVGLAQEIPDLQQRVNHILTQQVFGIAITQLTSLLARRSVYCSKHANGEHSVVKSFASDDGNIWFRRTEHSWEGDKCRYCGAGRVVFDRAQGLETHAYAFIHADNIRSRLAGIFDEKMQFDVIIGNPPYQMDDGGFGMSAAPIYHLFVEQAKRLGPRYLSMVIPARWFAGGKGLDGFRSEMLGDRRMRRLVDFESSSDVFPGVDVAGGICYFLWDRDNHGLCEVTNFFEGGMEKTERLLDEFPVFIRNSKAVPIIKKILAKNENGGKRLSEVVSPSKPFGVRGHHQPSTAGVPCYFTQKQGLLYVKMAELSDRYNLLDKYKLLVPRAPIAGQTDFTKPVGFYYEGNVRIAKPGEACTESWIVAFAARTQREVVSFKSYLFTKTVRFLLLQSVVSQDVTRSSFHFIPDLGKYEGVYTDSILCERWGIAKDEWDFIDSKIKAIAPDDE